MSYRCQICQDEVPQGTKAMKAVTRRPDGQIAAELHICETCDREVKKHLAGGVFPSSAVHLVIESRTPVHGLRVRKSFPATSR